MHTFRPRGATFLVACFALAAGTQTGCLSAAVKKSVSEANEAIILSYLGGDAAIGSPDGAAGTTDPEWKAASKRLGDYIAAHPDQPRTINALRVRQAMVLLSGGQRNSARAVFDTVDASMLSSERDQMLYQLRDHVIWWYSTTTVESAEDQEAARQALAAITVAADEEGRSQEIRRFLERMRMRIAFDLANSLPIQQEPLKLLEPAACRYAGTFSDKDRKVIEALIDGGDDRAVVESLENLRWYSYVPEAFQDAERLREDVSGEGEGLAMSPDWQAWAAASCPAS